MKRLLALCAAVLGVTCTSIGHAQTQAWPAQPIRLIVNFPPGGAADQLARMISQPLHTALGQPVVIENRAGANGNIGGQAAATAAPDGYTFLMSSGGMVAINPHIYTNMPFDPERDLEPVASVARVPFYLVVRADNPAKDYAGFIEDLKAHPGQRNFGSPGTGSSPHLAAEMLQNMTQTRATHVPYKGAAPALMDLLGGQIDFLFDPGIAIEHVESGKLRMLAVGSPERSPRSPDTATLHELGLTDFDADAIFGIYAPRGVDAKIIERFNAEVNRALSSPQVQQQIIGIGNTPSIMSAAEFKAKSDDDSRRFGEIIRSRNIKAD